MPFFSYLDRCTSSADQLIVTGDYADVLVLADRGFASDGVTFGVWYSSVAHQADTIADMQARPALFTVLMDEAELRAATSRSPTTSRATTDRWPTWPSKGARRANSRASPSNRGPRRS